jgi:hypothetical protein
MGNMRGSRVRRFGKRDKPRVLDLGIFGRMDVQVESMSERPVPSWFEGSVMSADEIYA